MAFDVLSVIVTVPALTVAGPVIVVLLMLTVPLLIVVVLIVG